MTIQNFEWYIERSPDLKTLKKHYYMVQMQLLKLRKNANYAGGVTRSFRLSEYKKAEKVFNQLGEEVKRRTNQIAIHLARPHWKLKLEDRQIKFAELD